MEWAVLLLATMMVWIAEFFNTALEAVVDLTMPNIHPLAKTATVSANTDIMAIRL